MVFDVENDCGYFCPRGGFGIRFHYKPVYLELGFSFGKYTHQYYTNQTYTDYYGEYTTSESHEQKVNSTCMHLTIGFNF
jgi:hypothetical protein